MTLDAIAETHLCSMINQAFHGTVVAHGTLGHWTGEDHIQRVGMHLTPRPPSSRAWPVKIYDLLRGTYSHDIAYLSLVDREHYDKEPAQHDHFPDISIGLGRRAWRLHDETRRFAELYSNATNSTVSVHGLYYSREPVTFNPAVLAPTTQS